MHLARTPSFPRAHLPAVVVVGGVVVDVGVVAVAEVAAAADATAVKNNRGETGTQNIILGATGRMANGNVIP